MTKHERLSVQAGPVVSHAAGSGHPRAVEVGGESRDLMIFKPVPGEKLTWKQPRFLRATYWLESGRGTHLLVHLPGGLIRSHRACQVEAATGSWTLDLGWGLGRRRIPLRDASGAELMRHERGLFGRGHVLLADGSKLAWGRRWVTFKLRDANDLELLSTRRTFAWFRDEGTVTLTDAALEREDLLPLLALNWLAALESRRHTY